MKRDEAEKLAAEAVRGMGLNTKPRVTDAILSAYRLGAEDMRARCAKWLDAEADTALGAEVAHLHRDADALRKLPLTDDQGEGDEQAGKTPEPTQAP